jgi:hypothetical protein
MLTKFDADGDGTISDTERQTMREARDAERLTKMDTDGDGTISDTERQAMREERKQNMDPTKLSALKERMMQKFDTDGDGVLSDEEREEVRNARGNNMNKSRTNHRRFIKKIDTETPEIDDLTTN